VISIVVGAALGFVILTNSFDISANAPLQIQTTATGVNYLSWSCQQLQDGVNVALAQGDNGSYNNMARESLQVAQIYLQIMQMKGCPISP
jgi:hypothetical protein